MSFNNYTKLREDLLRQTSQEGDIIVFRFLIQFRLDLNSKNEDGDNALILASSEGRNDIIKILLDEKVNIETKDSNGYTPFLLTSYYNHISTLKILKLLNHENSKYCNSRRQ